MGQNSIIVVLGASGNLAAKKLHCRGSLDEKLNIIGFDPAHLEHGDFIKRIESSVDVSNPEQTDKFQEFQKRCSYITIDQDAGDDSFVELRKRMASFIERDEAQNRYFYMALPPSIYVAVSQQLRRNCYSEKGHTQIIIEKPYGRDLKSSVELHRKLGSDWKENEIFRIDHYLGKEMVKNVMTLRFGNPIFGALWDCNHIDNVQKAAEATLMIDLGRFLPKIYGMRRVLRLVSPLDIRNTLIGQYAKSEDGKKPSYKDDDGVPSDSRCITFCTTVAYVKNARWEGVPFILKSGKALNESKTEIRIQLKDTTNAILRDTAHNQLIIRIQPDEALRLKMNARMPGLEMQTVGTELDLTYQRTVPDADIPEAYECLLLDAFKGDYSDSVTEQELEASWKIFTPLLHHIEEKKDIKPIEYAYGSEGPDGLEDFVSSYQYQAEPSR
ncbi:MAG: hypothetical protein L6R41_003918 [Letrouitia leprolyta]|nr:MAG: hypothetical protein L6R41_003918 [Letrouitia leprolyta]